MLPPLENGLVLLAHVNQHLGSGLGLRQILDWQMFVDAHLTDELWERSFQHAAQQIGMEKLAVTTTWLCRTYLGLQTPATWFSEADAQLASDLLLYIMQRGNMGRKMERGAQATRTVLHNLRSPAPWFAIFTRAGALIGRQRASTRGLLRPRASTKWGTLSARDSRATRA